MRIPFEIFAKLCVSSVAIFLKWHSYSAAQNVKALNLILSQFD